MTQLSPYTSNSEWSMVIDSISQQNNGMQLLLDSDHAELSSQLVLRHSSDMQLCEIMFV